MASAAAVTDFGSLSCNGLLDCSSAIGEDLEIGSLGWFVLGVRIQSMTLTKAEEHRDVRLALRVRVCLSALMTGARQG